VTEPHAINDLDHPVFDGDNHYYEALDAFTRHLDPRLGPRVIQWAEINGRKYHVIGGQVNRAVTNPTFDPVSAAGAMSEYFRGNASGKLPHEYLGRPEPIRPEYRDRDARISVMNEQGIDKIWLFPTLGMIYEEPLHHDPEAVGMLFTAFNRWLDEDWGFGYRNRIFASPYISLADVDSAVANLEWALSRGATTVCMRAAAPNTALGRRPPAHPDFDPFWARVNEAGITVVVHAGDSGQSANGYAPDGFGATFSGAYKPSIKSFNIERSIYDFLASIMFDELFVRFPNVRIASVENGAEFLGDLFRKLRSTSRKLPGFFKDDPTEIFNRHVWINPFWEDDVYEVAGLVGTDRVIFGSDWPHIEAMPRPLDYLVELKQFDAAEQRRILLDNVSELNELHPA
jgi:predicted TIM-barrel fold metal-dependent hydrolase